MNSNYNNLECFITNLNKHYSFKLSMGKKVLRDVKYNKVLRCPCRIFDNKKLNINVQCPNAIYTISNICYNCDKNNKQVGYVNIYPDQSIIDKYYLYSKQRKISFNHNSIHLGLYNKYINQYIKIKINDIDTCNSITLFKVPKKDDKYKNQENIGEYGTLIDKYHNHIGHYETWIDYNYSYPSKYKNTYNQILDPKDNIPLLTYDLNKQNIFHELTNRIYKKYRFSANKEAILLTNDVIDN